jgi:hypothetical protein
MSEQDTLPHLGHRERLRDKFAATPDSLSEAELLELLLTYALPRRDTAPLADMLIREFGSIDAVLSTSSDQLATVSGLGPASATFLKLIEQVMKKNPSPQPSLLPVEEQQKYLGEQAVERALRVFVEDEVANSLTFLPKASSFSRLDDFKKFLEDNLPYNSYETRQRRANYILDRFFPTGNLLAPLTYLLSQPVTEEILKPIVFYHILKAELLTTKVAEELIYPALPVGRIERNQLREFVLKYLPNVGDSSQKKMLRSIYNTYSLLGMGLVSGETLRFQLHVGSFEAFLYVLTSEFPQAGIYSFEQLYQSPLHRWMLWDREWLRRQLYNLRDFGILSKISEIDTVKQFSLELDQTAALEKFFEIAKTQPLFFRDKPGDEDQLS